MFMASGMPQWTALAFFLALMTVPVLVVTTAFIAQRLGARVDRVRKVLGFVLAVVGGVVMLTPVANHLGGVFLLFLSFLALTVVASLGLSRVKHLASKFAGGVTFDEGGARLRRFGRMRYVPFDRIADARVATDLFARPFLVIEETKGRSRRAPLLGSPTEALGAVLPRMRPFECPTSAAPLARTGQNLASWKAGIRSYASSGAIAYRDGGLTTEQLVGLVRNGNVDPEARAGAAFALIASGIEEGRAAVSEVLGGAPPPLVVAMASELATPETLREALPFLTKEERREVSSAPAKPPTRVRVADDARVRVGADEAEAAFSDRAPAASQKLKPEA